MRRTICWLTAFAVFISTLVLLPSSEVSAATDTVTIHYQRTDGDYEPWNIWAWPEGGDGTAYPFDGEDDFGKVANITVQKAADLIGFIVRTDSWEKDVGDDRFIDTSLGNEIWVFTGQSEFSYEPPAGYEQELNIDEFQLKLHYNRFDKDYADISFLFTYASGMKVTVNPAVVSDYALLETPLPYDKRIQLTVLKNGVEDDYLGSSFSTSKLSDNYQLEVYLMQGTGKISNSADLIQVEQKIGKAEISSINEIRVKLAEPIQMTEDALQGFQLSSDQTIASVTAEKNDDSAYTVIKDGYADYFVLQTEQAIDVSQRLTVTKDNLPAVEATIAGQLFKSKEFEAAYAYAGNDLGATYTAEKTTFKVWAPTASTVSVILYAQGEEKAGEEPLQKTEMTLGEKGVWTLEVFGDCKNQYYVYEVTVNGVSKVAVDPYAKAVGVNGNRGMVVDLPSTDPEGFRTHSVPETKNPTDAIIYEIHVRDLSMNDNSGMQNKGKFLGFTETGTTNTDGLSTGIDHMKELGITHVHLLPSFDYKTIDESALEENKFNWGYDPQNYNAPEGSYATDPYQGEVRVNEFKQMVQALHENGLKVVMDVVYNHTFTASDSNFEAIVPDYYYRKDLNGGFTNGSGCGNETASERAMMRKLIVDSVVYWATEYRVDGFRFDLMALHDIETMNQVRAALNEIDPTILVYGEGWTGGSSPLADSDKALKANMTSLDSHIAAFSDDIRDGIKGSVFNEADAGFVNSGKTIASNRDEAIKFGIVGSVQHPQVKGIQFWANNPTQTITYASAHDNLTLWDKLKATSKMASEQELVQMNKLSAAIVLTSQGIPFFQAGEEMARTKNGNENSYQAPDRINMLNWDAKTEYKDLVDYYSGLISLRKKYDVFRLTTAEEVRDRIQFVDTEFSVVAYTLQNNAGDYPQFAIVFNGTMEDKEVQLDANAWDVLVDGEKAGTEVLKTIKGGAVTIPAKTALVLGENTTAVVEEPVATPEEPAVTPDETVQTETEPPMNNNESSQDNRMNIVPVVVGVIVAIAACAGGFFLWVRRKK